MKMKLVFEGWRDKYGKPVEGNERIELEMGSFHGGTTFEANVEFSADDILDFERNARFGYSATFWVPPVSVNGGEAELAVAYNAKCEEAKSLQGQIDVLIEALRKTT